MSENRMLHSLDPSKQSDYDYDYVYDDLVELEDTMTFDHYYPDYSSETTSFVDISKACVLPTLLDVCSTYFPVLAICLLFQCFNRFVQRKFIWKHFLSGCLGVGILYSYVQNLIVHPIGLAAIAYLLVCFASHNKVMINCTSLLFLSYLTICEFICDGSSWARVRNVQMLIVMKLISLVSDLQNKLIRLPSAAEYFGFIFCVGNCIFGPWIDYSAYLDLFRPKKQWNAAIAVNILTSVFKSLIFFSASMCYVDWFWPQTNEPDSWLMYFKALEFRTSHYFIMFMSESFSLAIGHEKAVVDSSSINCITKPSSIEFPRSLVEVVVFWNVPMHIWLKKYVFKPLSKYGRFVAVIATFFVSSLLHGLNYQLSGILLSLAAYTYVEYVFRRKLSRKLDACLLSKSCAINCTVHRRTERLIPVRLLNLALSFVALYHLSYLGFLIDLRMDEKLEFVESFQKWKDKDFISHFIIFVTFGLSLFL